MGKNPKKELEKNHLNKNTIYIIKLYIMQCYIIWLYQIIFLLCNQNFVNFAIKSWLQIKNNCPVCRKMYGIIENVSNK